MTKERYDIYKRTFDFAVDTAKLIKNLNKNMITVEYAKQLIRSSGSIGANLEEADGAASKKDFINFLHHALKSANETRYWLELLLESGKVDNKNNYLLKEAIELSNILGSIILSLKGRK